MQRRRFIQVSGLSAASFLFAHTDPATGNTIQSDPIPGCDFCSLWWRVVFTAGHRTKTGNYEDIQVTLQVNGDVAFSVSSLHPVVNWNLLNARWKQTSSASSKYLDDHWERSYGDLSWEAPICQARTIALVYADLRRQYRPRPLV